MGSLGRLSGTLRHSWAPLVGLLCVPWAFLGCLLSLFEASWAPLKRFGIDFGEFLESFMDGLGGTWGVQDLKIIVFLRLPRL